MTTHPPQRKDFPVVGEYKFLIVEADGIRWLLEDRTGNDSLTVLHEQDPPGESVHDFICSKFAPGVTFLDIGAHEGHYALRAALAGCNVIAVEANPETAGLLRFNRDLNQLRADVWGFAAWDRAEPVTISVPVKAKLRNGSASVASPASDGEAAYEGLSITVMGFPIDHMPITQHVDLIKMDVEGADLHVIDGMMETICADRPLLILESHLQYGTYTEGQMQSRYDELTRRAGYKWCDMRDLGVKTPFMYVVGQTFDDTRTG